MTQDKDVIEMANAIEAGEAWAKGLKRGHYFHGARPEAERRYPGNDVAQRLFVASALDVLDKGRVVTAEDGMLVEDVIQEQCRWFLNCTNRAEGTRPHPVLGEVPICARCAAKVERLEGK